MKTINQVWTQGDFAILGHTSLMIEKSFRDMMRSTPNKTHIKIQFTPVEYYSENGYEWQCDHASRTAETEEYCDEYMEAVTGVPQSVHLEYVEVCDECGDVERLNIEPDDERSDDEW